jgi:hypothetical protein
VKRDEGSFLLAPVSPFFSEGPEVGRGPMQRSIPSRAYLLRRFGFRTVSRLVREPRAADVFQGNRRRGLDRTSLAERREGFRFLTCIVEHSLHRRLGGTARG